MDVEDQRARRVPEHTRVHVAEARRLDPDGPPPETYIGVLRDVEAAGKGRTTMTARWKL